MLDGNAAVGDGLEEYRRWHIKERHEVKPTHQKASLQLPIKARTS
ncbi:hypothetical protein [Tolypothrix sp. VBCCA 56010]